MKITRRIFPYYQSMLKIFGYQLISKLLIGLWLILFRVAFMWALHSNGRVALSSGDFMFFLTSWQGIIVIVLALLTLFLYTSFDLNIKILFSYRLLKQKPISLRILIKEAFLSIPRFFCLEGTGVVIYAALLAPILGVGLSLSLTENLYIPTFISSVIESTPLYNAIYLVFVIVFSFIGLANIFILHGVVADGLSVKESGKQSQKLMKENWKNYLKETLVFVAVIALIYTILFVLMLGTYLIIKLIPASELTRRFWILLIIMITASLFAILGLFTTPFYIMKTTELYYSYKEGLKNSYPRLERKKHPLIITGIILGLILTLLTALIVNAFFEEIFPNKITVGVIAHRGGGNEGAENTVSGLNTAYQLGATGSEIDIQRTKDGYYIVNHDGTFQRTAGVDKKPEEMTLEEIKKLSVDGEPIATLEEMLEASRGNLILFIELKGNTADKQMCDDAVRIIREYGMEKEAVLISLKYDLINYIETAYPDIETGFLTFLSFGDTASLNCDYIGLEEESATSEAIDLIHLENKKVLVWTVNDRNTQKHFLLTKADAIITDNVRQAFEVISELENRDELGIIFDYFLSR
ncbi:MAG: glycerophosphoryl diester phosphodiesterase membrane domain-containing protein [Erysipelotrichaceae bacterium]|nr:glycerophosphoryl diester phosphodiesterase membrane domain-containing protein [Erysipelotrichaceae bacterium]MBQ1521320.1 glycerophosphoryl diester phosphodiesterase membrane domain-containing protein [Erysipelotrichaceae bacterium]